MGRNKTSISKSRSYLEIGEYWNTHDLAEIWAQTEPAEFEVEIQAERKYYPIDRDLSNTMGKIAQEHGISTEALLNLWVQEKIKQGAAKHKPNKRLQKTSEPRR